MAQAGSRQRNLDRPPAQSRNPYLAVLRAPGAAAFSCAAFVGRMSMSMYGLGTVLLIATLTGRYGQAGIVAAASSVGYAVGSPVVAQLADRFGQGRVLVRQTAVFALSTIAFIGCAETGAPFWTLLVTGVLAGAAMPSIGSMVRSRWSALFAGDARRLHTAFALESVNDELIFVIGPALVTMLATQVLPAAGIGMASVLCVGGTLLFAAQRSSEPAPRARPRNTTQPSRATQPGQTAHPGQTVAGIRHRTARLRFPHLPAAGLVTLSPTFLLLGAMFSTIDLSTVAFATELGHRPAAGLILGSYALGSAVGGLWYGTRHWTAPIGRRFTTTAAITVVGVATFWAMPGLLALGAVGFLAGLAISPTLMTGYAILERQAPPHRTTEAMAWLSSTISVGVAIGSAVAGHIIDVAGARWGFGFAACCGAAAVGCCVAGLAKLRTRDDPEPAGSAASALPQAQPVVSGRRPRRRCGPAGTISRCASYANQPTTSLTATSSWCRTGQG
ncbi:MAG TPA: MFS transporter [Streptosporangiaceae bacterium]|nr:MFS transporter [Streptosporangiaceae bacterium]